MENSTIEWTHHTFNPWWGCTKVSAACKHCYADSLAKRYGHNVWGKHADRRFLSDNNWRQPLRWNAKAAAHGERARVFCASMADVFEDRRDLDEARRRLWALIATTTSLDWLLLTKRPEAIARLVPWGTQWPRNVWIGTTVENQKVARERLPHLVELPAVVRFISAEPLLGPLDLSPWISGLDWVIAGGETGHGARPSSPAWFKALRKQCRAADVAFHFKQWGDYAPIGATDVSNRLTVDAADGTTMIRMGKSKAGRLLKGRTWDELPVPRAA